MNKISTALSHIHDPAKSAGTAWWACLVVGLWSALHQGLHMDNGVFLLGVAGIKALAPNPAPES